VPPTDSPAEPPAIIELFDGETLGGWVTEGGRSLPAKVVVRGRQASDDPDWGDVGGGSAAKNFAYVAGAADLFLPPGEYRVSVHHGPEYTDHVAEVSVTAGSVATVRADLQRAIATRGWVSADLHVHALPSFDAPTLLADRVRSLAAVDVEVAVATDHNAVTDYGPTIAALALEQSLTSVVGDEVTTEGVLTGHYNVFPLAPGSPALRFDNVAPSELFRAARARSPEPLVVQVNHPRMGSIGYFDLFRFDREDVSGWLRRATAADVSFDALEVFSGDHYDDVEEVERVLRDWYALLDVGHRIVATGNSDSHSIAYHEAGVPRNWVYVGVDQPARVSQRAFVDAVRAGRVVVSSGPFIDLRVGGQMVGGTVGAGSVAVEVAVDGAPWIDLAEVEIVVRGVTRKRWTRGDGGPRRLVGRATLELERGDWVIAIARGARAMPHLYRSGALPFAFTNPVWVE
jgi:hypothetical protein